MYNNVLFPIISGIILALMAFVSVQRVNHPRFFHFAMILLILAMEQFCTALVALAVDNPAYDYLKGFFTLFLLIISQIIWPVWIPFALQRMETVWAIRRLLIFFVYLGILVALFTTWDYIFYEVSVTLEGDEMRFIQNGDRFFQAYGVYFWMGVTLLPAFISYTKRMWIVGLTLALAYAVMRYMNPYDFVFFSPIVALVLGGSIYFVLLDIPKSKPVWHG
ncbi:hypothetical protein [Flavobacterium sp.]|jgi:hypothetical protein|uniref:hypothetical protein n=1 Tax=Flavobacterium sp. TaxID=239 RepID=UPI0022BA9F55|nr:hypothetical protein [Flavobacterium sp.]MCZ8170033.1 hypothetical protein [Flavobacterium sp.]MCZ8298436.1 hypothetical protein [Flavobacterium sp.]